MRVGEGAVARSLRGTKSYVTLENCVCGTWRLRRQSPFPPGSGAARSAARWQSRARTRHPRPARGGVRRSARPGASRLRTAAVRSVGARRGRGARPSPSASMASRRRPWPAARSARAAFPGRWRAGPRPSSSTAASAARASPARRGAAWGAWTASGWPTHGSCCPERPGGRIRAWHRSWPKTVSRASFRLERPAACAAPTRSVGLATAAGRGESRGTRPRAETDPMMCVTSQR